MSQTPSSAQIPAPLPQAGGPTIKASGVQVTNYQPYLVNPCWNKTGKLPFTLLPPVNPQTQSLPFIPLRDTITFYFGVWAGLEWLYGPQQFEYDQDADIYPVQV